MEISRKNSSELFAWKIVQLSLRGLKPEAIPQIGKIDCFVAPLLAMTIV